MDCLTKIMNHHDFNDFRLVGGTALALQIGHRQSIDIDLFSDKFKYDYNFENIFGTIKTIFSTNYTVNLRQLNSTGLACILGDNENNLKVDLYKWSSPFLAPAVLSENIRMAGLDDIVAIKMEAIDNRNNYRDYVDIAFLSEKYTLAEMLALYTKKTLSKDYTRIIRALSNPDDLVRNQELIYIKNITESELKEKIDYMLFVYINEEEQKLKQKKKL